MTEDPKDLKWLKDKWSALVTLVAAILSVLLSPFVLDVESGVYVALAALAIFALWFVWRGARIGLGVRVVASILVVGMTVGWGYLLYWSSQPHFEITAFDTLEGEENVYELTDQLVWNQEGLDEYGVVITFTLEVRPIYFGKQRFGKVVALISGDGEESVEKPLWDDFTKASGTRQIQLTLPELLGACGLRTNTDPPRNPFRPGEVPSHKARLSVAVARQADKTDPWDGEEIVIHNAPWEFHSDLVWRNGKREVDVYVRNLGGRGEFTVRYRLVRLDEEIDAETHPMLSGATEIGTWNAPGKLVGLEKGEFFTDTVQLPGELMRGRYLLEAYAVKKQNYVQFQDTASSWEDLNSLKSPWWFGRSPFDMLIFVHTAGFPVEPTVQAEWNRLRDEQSIDLGLATGPVEEVTSATGSAGVRQVFQEGEIYVHGGQAYALYGPILEHYRKLADVPEPAIGFPISSMEAVASSFGTRGTMMAFEFNYVPHSMSVIYVSEKGVGATWGWISQLYAEEKDGVQGWLGFPVSDEREYSDAIVQMFEGGYFVYYIPDVGGERDWSREPVAYPYLASRGTLFDVHAQQVWQDTGVQVAVGDRVTIVQVGGTWTNRAVSEGPFDANGNAGVALQGDAALPSALVGTLLGRIGEGSDRVFAAGRWGVITAPAEGTLYLAMNDNNYEDNGGFITVQIMVERSE
jgi:hypothetical protein